ncbi:MAG: UDP-glucose 4-epimerase GalE [Parachlamydiaceae bacterium]
MQTILVTGGAGFIGSHVNLLLNEAGYQTIVYDNLSRGDTKSIKGGVFIEGDLADIDGLFKNHKIDAVIHFAALTDVGESVINPLLYYNNNVLGTLRLLDAMQKNGVDKIIFSSSAAVYGIPDEIPITEKARVSPINPYGKTKAMIESVLADLPIKSISLRYFNAAGGDPHGILKNYKKKENNLIPLLLRGLKEGKTLQVYGSDYDTPDGTCIRDYIHVSDLASAHLLALNRLLEGGKTDQFNLGIGRGFSVLEVIEAAERTLKRKVPYTIGPRRPGDPARLIADSHKAKKELFWEPRYVELEKIILDAWNALT